MAAFRNLRAVGICTSSFIRPLMKRLKKNIEPPVEETVEDEAGEEDVDAVVDLSHEPEPMGGGPRVYESNLEAAKVLAKEDPKVVATIIKGWVGVAE